MMYYDLEDNQMNKNGISFTMSNSVSIITSFIVIFPCTIPPSAPAHNPFRRFRISMCRINTHEYRSCP